ncbi:glycosidase, partial [Vibrio parahaemolyticus]|nr:glycosidase [Vibrio parahaemolyticus]
MKKLIIKSEFTLAAVSIFSACSSKSSENTSQDEVNNSCYFTYTLVEMRSNW